MAEDAIKIRTIVEFKKGKRYRAEDEARDKAESEIKEKAEKASEATEKADADTAERAREWDEAKAREKAEIVIIYDKAREKVAPEDEVTARTKEKAISA